MIKILPPLRAIRGRCLDCRCWIPSEVRYCDIPACPVYPFRMGHKPQNSATPLLPVLKAIRLKCLDDCADQPKEVRLCVCKDCELYPYRFGKNPSIKRRLTDEQRKAISERLRRGRKNKANEKRDA